MNLLKDINNTPSEPLEVISPPKLNLQWMKAVLERQSLIKELVNTTASVLKTADGSDAGAGDVMNKVAPGSDVSFSLMRNTINSDGEVTGSDVADYIERAEELNDEVDTVPFGLETDDGQIVKVYVNAEQADKFEEAMKNMLGMEDDIEAAINRLTGEFDIVDVVWPQGGDDGEGEGGAEEDPDADLSIDDVGAPEEDDDFAEGNYDDVTGDSAKVKDGGATPSEDDPEDDESDDDSTDADDTEGAEDGDDEDELDDDGNPKKKKRKKKKAQPAEPADDSDDDTPRQESLETSPMTIGSSFLKRVIGEASDNDGVKDGLDIKLDSQARALAARNTTAFAKRLVAFFFMCGVSGKNMNAADTESSLAEGANVLRTKPAIRKAFIAFYEALATAKGFAPPANESLEEAEATGKRKRGDSIQKILETVLITLGLPAKLTTGEIPAATTGIYVTSQLVEQDSGLEQKLRALAARLGIKSSDVQDTADETDAKSDAKTSKDDDEDLGEAKKDDDRQVTIQGRKGMKSTPFSKTFKNQAALEKWMDKFGDDVSVDRTSYEKSINEDADIASSDAYVKTVLSICSALGIPDAVLERGRSALIPALQDKHKTLNVAAVNTAAGRLQDALKKATKPTGGQGASQTPNQGASQTGTATNTPESKQPSGRWKFLSDLK